MEVWDDGFWQEQFSASAQNMGSSFTRELFKLAARPGVISLAAGSPSSELLPIEALQKATDKVLLEHGRIALQYTNTEGMATLREWVAAQFSGAALENVQITSGSQQAINLVAKTLVNPGDKIILESPTYLGAIQSFRAYRPEFLSVPVDQDGLCVDELEPLLKQKPKFIYVLPNFQNPSGSLMSLERRQKLVELCRAYRVPIFEDDAYHYLSFSGEVPPTLYDLDAQLGGGNVVYTSTFSKTIAPALRVAWLVGPKALIAKICQMKQGSDSHTSLFNQMLVYELAPQIQNQFVPQIQQKYTAQCSAMLEGLQKYLPQIRYNAPQGGMFVWAKLPEGLDSLQLLDEALHRQQVAFVPGTAFYPDNSGHDAIRLSFSLGSPERLHEGLKRLAKAIEAMSVMG